VADAAAGERNRLPRNAVAAFERSRDSTPTEWSVGNTWNVAASALRLAAVVANVASPLVIRLRKRDPVLRARRDYGATVLQEPYHRAGLDIATGRSGSHGRQDETAAADDQHKPACRTVRLPLSQAKHQPPFARLGVFSAFLTGHGTGCSGTTAP
jgi:hypothetical protein